ncbi:MAG: transglycosylase SLT domain-containing protein [Vampirovibrionales bacterium]|nr:transglycosylase SLT domain-containing protein [Vampirovibrionales bacterium]
MPKATSPYLAKLSKKIGIALGLTLLAVAIVGGLFWAKQQNLLPPNGNWQTLKFWPQSENPELLYASSSLSHADARALYLQSLGALKNQDPSTALDGFNQLEPVYPGLKDLIYLHQAEAQAAMGQEAAAQQKLQAISREFPASPLKLKAQYLLAQSHVRANEPQKARQVLNNIRQNAPQSDYGIGSLYYLGLIAQPTNPVESRGHWLSYLEQCPNCTFSGDSAEALQAQILNKQWTNPSPDGRGHLLIGTGLVTSRRQWPNAVSHLTQAPFDKAWYYLGSAYLETNASELAADAFSRGLIYSQDGDQTQKAIDWLVKSAPSPRLPRLEALVKLPIPKQGDYLLWQLAQVSPEKAADYYQQIIARYPDGDYAPESSWNLLWPLLSSGQYSAYIQQSAKHIQRYHYAKSTPKAIFWVGKSYEKSGSKESAKATYKKLIAQYPGNYYAFRAKSRFDALNGGSDRGWETSISQYKPAFSLTQLNILPSLDAFSSSYQKETGSANGARRTYNALKELQAIGAADDVLALSEEVFEKIPAPIASWAYQQNGERPKGIREIRDDLQNRKKDAPQTAATSLSEEKLLYPVYFSEQIAEASPRYQVDPHIIQGLMREESYFNEFAVSTSDARGLMQLLPSTASEVANWESLDGFQVMNLFDPATNIRLGTRYLQYLHAQFSDKPSHLRSMAAVGAYNGGPNAMKRWIASNPNFSADPDLFVEEIPYEQTREYIKKVFGSAWNYQALYQ